METTTASASRPWNESTLATSTSSAPGARPMRAASRSLRCISRTCAAYGDCTAICEGATPAHNKPATCMVTAYASPSFTSDENEADAAFALALAKAPPRDPKDPKDPKPSP